MIIAEVTQRKKVETEVERAQYRILGKTPTLKT